MKRIITVMVLAALMATPALAERINLSKTGGYGALKQFYNVVNDANPVANITIVESTGYTSVYVTIDGKQYGSPTGGGAGLDGRDDRRDQRVDAVAAVLPDAVGIAGVGGAGDGHGIVNFSGISGGERGGAHVGSTILNGYIDRAVKIHQANTKLP